MLDFRSILKKHPVWFDRLKTVSRLCGNTTPLFRVLNAIIPGNKPLTFIQMGAHDGLSHDPYREFLLRANMHGIVVEPLPFLFEKLEFNYKVKPSIILENCAASYPSGPCTLWTLDPKVLAGEPHGVFLSLLASFSKELLIEHLPPRPELHQAVIPFQVRGETIESLMQKHRLNHVDCLFLDMEGYEPTLLMALDYDVVSPRIISYENLNLGGRREAIVTHLLERDYSLIDLPQETVAIRNTHLREYGISLDSLQKFARH